MLPRYSGVLLHPTSLPGAYGIGSIGKEAFSFVDYLFDCGFHLWQVLPLGPTTFGDSPYSALSSFAGSPYLIDLETLAKKYNLPPDMIAVPKKIQKAKTLDFGLLYQWKLPLLDKIALYIIEQNDTNFKSAFDAFAIKNGYWLDDWADYITLKNFYDRQALKQKVYGINSIWSYFWPEQIKKHLAPALATWRQEHTAQLQVAKCVQFLFQEQWASLKAYAKSKNVFIIGDIPIFCATDSADVWANQDLFMLNSKSRQKAMAGVPPDYFSPTGQLWGNPLYKWAAHKKTHFAWWKNRIKRTLDLCDYIRIDHFRGLEAFWTVKAGSLTAQKGKWTKAPGAALLKELQKEFGSLPLIAEDLGVITKQVEALRDDFGLAGMKVLQFAFDVAAYNRGDMKNPFLPHNHTQNSVCYTGTHDNNTTQGYIKSNTQNPLGQQTNSLIAKYLFQKDFSFEQITTLIKTKKLTRKLVIEALKSVCCFAILPLQDILGLTEKAQMNRPSTQGGNWLWRLSDMADLDKKGALFLRQELRLLNSIFGRV